MSPAVSEPARRPVGHDVLTALVKLQDLDLMIREAADPRQADEVSKLGFPIGGLDQLRAAREVLAAAVEPRFLRLYDAAVRRYGGRALVPVANRTCLGCSAVQPTGVSPDPQRIPSCQSCGRILYPL